MAARAAELDERPHARYPIAVCFGGIESGSFFELLQRFQKVCGGNDILTARNLPGQGAGLRSEWLTQHSQQFTGNAAPGDRMEALALPSEKQTECGTAQTQRFVQNGVEY